MRLVPTHTRIATGVLDQVVSSVGNSLIVIAIARVSSPDQFGTFGLLFSLVTVALAITRGAIGSQMLRLSGSSKERLGSELRNGVAGALQIGVIAAFIVLVGSSLLGELGLGATLAVALPLVLAQDAYRHWVIATGRPAQALTSDGLWCLGSGLLLLATVVFRETLPITTIILGWGAFALMALLVLAVPSRQLPTLEGLRGWWRDPQAHRIRYGLEGGLGALAAFVVLLITVWIVGSSAAAALRGASTVFGPMSVLIAAAPLVALPELSRSNIDSSGAWTHLKVASVVMSLGALLLGLVAWSLPAGIGESILGDSWPLVRPVLPFTALEYAAIAWIAGITTRLRAFNHADLFLGARVRHAVLSVCLAFFMAVVATTAVAIAAGLAVAAFASLIATIVQLRRRSLA